MGLAWGRIPPRELDPSLFRPPRREGERFPFRDKPAGGLWLSLWVEGYGPEWGIPWLLECGSLPGDPALVLRSPVWEVDLRGLRLEVASRTPPDWERLFLEKDGLVVPYHALREAFPYDYLAWWRLYDVDTVWLAVWPGEERLRRLGTLGEVVPERALRELEERYRKDLGHQVATGIEPG